MTLQLEARHDLTPNEIDAIEDRLYEHNSRATGRHNGQGLGFVIRDDAGEMIGAAAGYTPGFPNSSRCGSIRHIVDAAMHVHSWKPLSRRLAVEAFAVSGWRASISRRRECMKKQASSAWPSSKVGLRATSMSFSARRFKPHACVRSIAIAAESGTVDQAGTDRTAAFSSSSKALLMSRMLTTPIRV
jgi:hypothetical protein